MNFFILQTVVAKVTAGHDRSLFLQANEPAAVKIQAQWRGHKAKKEYENRKHFIQTQLPAIVKIQVSCSLIFKYFNCL